MSSYLLTRVFLAEVAFCGKVLLLTSIESDVCHWRDRFQGSAFSTSWLASRLPLQLLAYATLHLLLSHTTVPAGLELRRRVWRLYLQRYTRPVKTLT